MEQAADLAAVQTAEDGGANLSDILANPDQATELKKVVDKTEGKKRQRSGEILRARCSRGWITAKSRIRKSRTQAQLDAAEAAKAAAEAAAENSQICSKQ